jgi:hypothetical protein
MNQLETWNLPANPAQTIRAPSIRVLGEWVGDRNPQPAVLEIRF